MTPYSFVTRWEFSEPLGKVWEAIYHPDDWPKWWSGLERVILLKPATGQNGVGSVRRFVWKSVLPYRLTVDMDIQRVEKLRLIESTAVGELKGVGCWTFSPRNGNTILQYDWNVSTTKPWMNFLAPVARPLFSWNHDVLMDRGKKGLARHLARQGDNTIQ